MGIGWLRFTSIYLDLEFRFEFRLEEDLILFDMIYILFNLDLDKFC